MITPAVRKSILAAISKGTPRRFAAAAAGVGERTLYKYLREGRLAKSGEAKAFYAAIRAAEAKSVAVRVERLNLAAKKGAWQADCWWLERRYREEFGADRGEVKALQKQVADLLTRLEQLTRASSPPSAPSEPSSPAAEPAGESGERAPGQDSGDGGGDRPPEPPAS